MIEIRETQVTDAESLATCIDSVARERKYLAATTGFSATQTAEFVAAVKASGGVHLVASADNRVIGWCDISFLPFEGFAHAGRLGMGLLPEFRQQGLGASLLQKALETASEMLIERIELEVFASNTNAIKLYQKFGFSKEGTKANARKLDGVYDDIVLMAISTDIYARKI